MNVDFNVTEVIKFVVENYGLAGFALMFWMWHGHQMQKKIDLLSVNCSKMYGIMLSISDSRYRNESDGG